MPAPPGLVTLTLWGVPARAVPAALGRMAADRRLLRGVPGLRFAKLLGTGDGRTFTLRDADPRHWGLLAVWDDDAAAEEFATGRTHRRWQRLAEERLHVRMTPLASRGRWAGREPFGRPRPPRTSDSVPVAAITRARLRPSRALSFWRAVPAVSADLARSPGLQLAVGIGESPIGLQGTFSLWASGAALTEFAHHRAPHTEVARRTPGERWYAEELFARFTLRDVDGTFAGRTIAGARKPLPAATPTAHPADRTHP